MIKYDWFVLRKLSDVFPVKTGCFLLIKFINMVMLLQYINTQYKVIMGPHGLHGARPGAKYKKRKAQLYSYH